METIEHRSYLFSIQQKPFCFHKLEKNIYIYVYIGRKRSMSWEPLPCFIWRIDWHSASCTLTGYECIYSITIMQYRVIDSKSWYLVYYWRWVLVSDTYSSFLIPIYYVPCVRITSPHTMTARGNMIGIKERSYDIGDCHRRTSYSIFVNKTILL